MKNTVLFRYGEVTDQEMNTGEKMVCHPVDPEEEHSKPWGAPRGHSGVGQEAGGGGTTLARSFIVVSVGRNGQGRVSRFKIGRFA